MVKVLYLHFRVKFSTRDVSLPRKSSRSLHRGLLQPETARVRLLIFSEQSTSIAFTTLCLALEGTDACMPFENNFANG